MINLRHTVSLFVVACAAAGVSAQTGDVMLQDSIAEIVVTGTGTEHLAGKAPVHTEVITSKDLESYASRGLEDIISGLCSSIDFSSGDMGSNIRLNGLGNDYILIMVDNKRLNGDVGGQNDLSMINPDNIERIEIVRGAASSLYGSDAIAGVINIITKKRREPFSVSNTTRAGAYGEVRQSNVISFNKGNVSSSTSLSVYHTDGWQNTDKEWYHYDLLDGSVTKTVSRSTNYSVAQNLQWKVNRRLTLSADASFYQKWIMRPTGPYQYYRYDYQYRNQSYAAGARYRTGDRSYIDAGVSYDRYNYYYDYTQIETTDDFDDSDPPKRLTYYPGMTILQTSQRKAIAHAKAVMYLGENNVLNAGAEYMWDKLVSPTRLRGNSASVYTLSAYAQDEWTIAPDLVMTAGVRLVHHKEFGQRLTPKVALHYSPGDFSLRATYSSGFKAPTVKELYYDYITVIMSHMKAYYGNRNLAPQTSDYVSFDAGYDNGTVSVSLTGYYNRLRNMIALVEIPTSAEDKLLEVEATMQYKNLTRARTYGADFSIDWKIGYGFAVRAGYSYVDAKAQYADDPSSPDYMKMLPVNATCNHIATCKASWGHEWKNYTLGIDLYGRYQSEKYYIMDGNGRPFQIWRLNTSHTLLKSRKWTLKLNAGVDNIFNYIDDTPFGRNRGTTNPGRTLYASLAINFKNK